MNNYTVQDARHVALLLRILATVISVVGAAVLGLSLASYSPERLPWKMLVAFLAFGGSGFVAGYFKGCAWMLLDLKANAREREKRESAG